MISLGYWLHCNGIEMGSLLPRANNFGNSRLYQTSAGLFDTNERCGAHKNHRFFPYTSWFQADVCKCGGAPLKADPIDNVLGPLLYLWRFWNTSGTAALPQSTLDGEPNNITRIGLKYENVHACRQKDSKTNEIKRCVKYCAERMLVQYLVGVFSSASFLTMT